MIRTAFALAILTVGGVFAAAIVPPYNTSYSLVDLGAASTVTAPYGGLVIKAGDTNTLLFGGAANLAPGVIDAVGLSRGPGGHITGFTSVSQFSTAPNIDGGLAYAPNGDLLFTGFPTNTIGMIKPGSISPDKTVTSPTPSSVGTLGFVPAGFAGAGNFVIGSFSASVFCTAALIPDGSGTFNVGGCANAVTTSGGPEGIIWVPLGSALFPAPSVLVSEFGGNRVSAYTIDANGLPNPASRTDFITGLSGAEGGTIDPVTGDFLFSTFGGGNHVFEIRGFGSVTPTPVPEPGTVLLLAAGLTALLALRRRA